MRISTLVTASLIPAALAAPSAQYKIHEQRSSLHRRFEKAQPAADDGVITASIALKQSNVEEADKLLLEISDPDSPKYGQHLSAQEVIDLFAAPEDSISQVQSWLIDSGVPKDSIEISGGKNWIFFNTTAGKLGSLLKTEYHHYNRRGFSELRLGTESYSLPAEISSLVDFVHPGIALAQMESRSKPKLSRRRDNDRLSIDPDSLDTCDSYVTPQCIAAMYNIPEGTLAHKGNELGVYEDSTNVYSQIDLDKFYVSMAPRIPQGTGPVVHLINGGHAPAAYGGTEAQLDFCVSIPIIYPQNASLFQTNTQMSGYHLDNFMNAIKGPYCHDNGAEGNGRDCNKLDQPNTLSVSYGISETPGEESVIIRQCTEWMKFGLTGTSVFAFSGDNGVSQESGCLGSNNDIFAPEGRPACPYVTGVGGTTLPPGGKIGAAETATTVFPSGGGFSNLFARPAWQHNAVAKYLDKYVPDYKGYNFTGKIPTTSAQGVYNHGGRGYPDISAVAQNGVIVDRAAVLETAWGTSMSTPIVAAMFNRINEERLEIGKKPLGFINPALYKAYAKGLFTDVVEGDQSPGGHACGTNKGFSAAPGWDPVTGLGILKYDKMLAYFKNL